MDEKLISEIKIESKANLEKSLAETDSQNLTQMPLLVLVHEYVTKPIQRIYNREEYMQTISISPGSPAWKDLMIDFAVGEIIISKAKMARAYEELRRRQLNF